MAQGFFGGVIWGGVVAAAGLVLVSQLVAPPVMAPRSAIPGAEAPAAAPVAPAQTPPQAGSAEPTPTTAPVATDGAAAPLAQVEAPASKTPAPDSRPSKTTEPAAPEPALPEPATPEEPAGEAEQALPDPTPAPALEPQSDPPAAVPQPDLPPKAPADVAPSAPTPPATASDGTDLPPADPAPASPAAQTLLPASDSDATPPAADLPPPPPPMPQDEALLVPPAPVQPNPAPALIVPDVPLPEPAPEPAPEPEPASSTLVPDTGLTPAVEGVLTDRLPRIGAAAPAETARTPLTAYARPFENPAAKPLFAILLLDTGGPDVDRTALAALPFPISFVIDPLAPDAATAAAIYRAAGQEVLMAATGIPAGATAADLEQTFQAHDAALPQAVAVVDLPEAGFQEDRPLATQVVPVIAAQGRGLVTFDRGLNAADQVARRADLPAATIFRRLDAEAEDAPVIRRYLDRAAFKAAQEGRVVVQGTTRPETVQALLEWTVEGRAASVALAPLSAVLTTD